MTGNLSIPECPQYDIIDVYGLDLLSPDIRTEKELFDIVIHHFTSIAGVEHSWILRFDPVENRLIRVAGTGYYADARTGGPVLDGCEIGKGVSGLAFRDAQCCLIENYNTWPGRLPGVPADMRSAIACPIWADTADGVRSDRPYGVLACCGPEPHIPDSLDVFVRQYAQLLSLALCNLRLRNRLYDECKVRDRLASMASRMEAVGCVTSSVVHDFRNVLTTIAGRADLAVRLLGPDPEVNPGILRNLDAIIEVCDLANRMCETLLSVVREKNTRETCVTGPLFMQIERLLRPLVQKHGRLNMHIECAQDIELALEEADVVRILINLVTNAIEAKEDGECKISIAIRECRDASHELFMQACGIPVLRNSHPAGCVVFDVTDNGPGIPPDVAERMFDPLYTTKNQGTGLGLATVYRLMRECGGNLSYRTGGQGTTFRVCIPIAETES